MSAELIVRSNELGAITPDLHIIMPSAIIVLKGATFDGGIIQTG